MEAVEGIFYPKMEQLECLVVRDPQGIQGSECHPVCLRSETEERVNGNLNIQAADRWASTPS